jgi:hypothetical protein
MSMSSAKAMTKSSFDINDSKFYYYFNKVKNPSRTFKSVIN